MSKEIILLKRHMKAKTISTSQLSVKLGYRSPNTVYTWLQKGQVPKSAMERVRTFLKKHAA